MIIRHYFYRNCSLKKYPDVSGYWEKQALHLDVINHAEIKADFKQYLLTHQKQLKLMNDLYESTFVLFQNADSHNEMIYWLLDHIDENWTKSPYSMSFYNTKDVGWNHKPEGSLRISDHWNFETYGQRHCQTLDPNFKLKPGQNALGQYEHGKYRILKVFNNQS